MFCSPLGASLLTPHEMQDGVLLQLYQAWELLLVIAKAVPQTHSHAATVALSS